MLIIVRALACGRKQGLFSKIPLVHVCIQIHLTGACQLLNCEQIYSSDIDSSIGTCKTYPSLRDLIHPLIAIPQKTVLPVGKAALIQNGRQAGVTTELPWPWVLKDHTLVTV